MQFLEEQMVAFLAQIEANTAYSIARTSVYSIEVGTPTLIPSIPLTNRKRVIVCFAGTTVASMYVSVGNTLTTGLGIGNNVAAPRFDLTITDSVPLYAYAGVAAALVITELA